MLGTDNTDYRIVTVSEAILEKSFDWGKKTQAKMSRISDRKRVGRGFQSMADRAVGKIAEAAFAQIMGLDVGKAVEWRVTGKGDGHRDLTVTINDTPKTVDVKASSHPSARFLIWPRTQDMSQMADILVFAKVADLTSPMRGQVFVPGFILKNEFIRGHEMRDLRHDGDLSPVMDWRNLHPIPILKNAIRACRVCHRSTPLEFQGAGYCPDHPPHLGDGV